MHEYYDDYEKGNGDDVYLMYGRTTFKLWIESVNESYFLPYNMNTGATLASHLYNQYPAGDGYGFGYWQGL